MAVHTHTMSGRRWAGIISPRLFSDMLSGLLGAFLALLAVFFVGQPETLTAHGTNHRTAAHDGAVLALASRPHLPAIRAEGHRHD